MLKVIKICLYLVIFVAVTSVVWFFIFGKPAPGQAIAESLPASSSTLSFITWLCLFSIFTCLFFLIKKKLASGTVKR